MFRPGRAYISSKIVRIPGQINAALKILPTLCIHTLRIYFSVLEQFQLKEFKLFVYALEENERGVPGAMSLENWNVSQDDSRRSRRLELRSYIDCEAHVQASFCARDVYEAMVIVKIYHASEKYLETSKSCAR
ncbi:unnamed protein product [Trichogramma brassicae]|uniref:Uncharacterized protein n=1 Tax=Trichogramma brassicae TaxID=86971 RepID=A0A6H5J9U5_9HYME|nr:unnamed protein product [Trichogramma brassicae]